MTDIPTLAPSANRTIVKQLHCNIIKDLREDGYTYDQIAQIFNVKDGSAVRQYWKRQSSYVRRSGAGGPEGGGVMEQIHAAIALRANNLGKLIRPEVLKGYDFDVSPGFLVADLESSEDTRRRTERHSGKVRALYEEGVDLFDSAHHLLGADPTTTIEKVKYIAGKYFLYRASSGNDRSGSSNVVIKSLLQIRLGKKDEMLCRYRVEHPDREYDPIYRRDTPITTHGICLYTGGHHWLIGNTENGQAVSVIAIREPAKADFNVIVGFLTTTNADRVLINGRVVLIRDKGARVSGIRRIHESEFDEKQEKFSLELLGGKPTIFDKSSKIRRFPAPQEQRDSA